MVWLSTMAVVLGVVAIALGRTFFAETETFKWIWRLVWFVGVPVLLLASYRLAVRGRSESSHDTEQPQGSD